MPKLQSKGFFSKYPFKNQNRKGWDISYEGLISECPKELLDQVELDNPDYKFVIIYYKKSK